MWKIACYLEGGSLVGLWFQMFITVEKIWRRLWENETWNWMLNIIDLGFIRAASFANYLKRERKIVKLEFYFSRLNYARFVQRN